MIELETQRAIYNALSNDSPIAALVGNRIYDNVPQKTTFPYITIGESTCNDWSADDFSGMEVDSVIHVWSRQQGRSETKTIQGAIYNALHRSTLTVTGYEFVKCDFSDSQSFVDSDGKTRHGIQTFNLLIKEV